MVRYLLLKGEKKGEFMNSKVDIIDNKTERNHVETSEYFILKAYFKKWRRW